MSCRSVESSVLPKTKEDICYALFVQNWKIKRRMFVFETSSPRRHGDLDCFSFTQTHNMLVRNVYKRIFFCCYDFLLCVVFLTVMETKKKYLTNMCPFVPVALDSTLKNYTLHVHDVLLRQKTT
jgi:hypothetical protein